MDHTNTYKGLLQEVILSKLSVKDLAKIVTASKSKYSSTAFLKKIHETLPLAVIVDWKNKPGKNRHDQCIRSLFNLAIGDQVAVTSSH